MHINIASHKYLKPYVSILESFLYINFFINISLLSKKQVRNQSHLFFISIMCFKNYLILICFLYVYKENPIVNKLIPPLI